MYSDIKNLKNVITTDSALAELRNFIAGSAYSKYIFLVDNNTASLCLPKVMEVWPENIKAEIVKISAGEKFKNISVCQQIWRRLTRMNVDRHALLINLGGGVVCDMGGLCAATYKRGIDFINVPTTLLAMVDAAIGGKTGVNLGMFKNQIGVFAFPQAVFINTAFLNTLPVNELKNGYAEIIKHALIADKKMWHTLMEQGFEKLSTCIENSVFIKTEIVKIDPFEKNKRKLLNFGHTVGHALEMLSPEIAGRQLSHGEAIAEGIIAESYISTKMAGLPLADADKINGFVRRFFPPITFTKGNTEAVYELMLHDKKNRNGKIKMTLLNSPGKGIFNAVVGKDVIIEYLKKDLKL